MRDANQQGGPLSPRAVCPNPLAERADHSSDLALLALRYAAGELDPTGVETFEARLGADQTARDALAEAVRLSAAATGVPAPTPDPLTREAARERLNPTWVSRLFPRRPYRGHPLAWAGAGGAVAVGVAVCVSLALAPEPEPYLVVRHNPGGRLIPMSVHQPHAAIDGDPNEGVVPTAAGASGVVQRLPDPPASRKLNPMGFQDRSPVANNLIPPADTGPTVGASEAPKVMPPTNPLAESKADQEQTDPMAPATGETKKG